MTLGSRLDQDLAFARQPSEWGAVLGDEQRLEVGVAGGVQHPPGERLAAEFAQVLVAAEPGPGATDQDRAAARVLP